MSRKKLVPIIGITALLVAWISQFWACSLSSDPWNTVFCRPWGPHSPNMGGFLEALRSLYLVCISIYLLGYLFYAELRLVFHFFRRSAWSPLFEGFFRTVTIVGGLITFAGVTYYHFNQGAGSAAHQLAQKYEEQNFIARYRREHGELPSREEIAQIRKQTESEWEATVGDPEKRKDYIMPYRYYYPQSLINFFFIAFPVFVVSVYGGIGDYRRISAYIRNYRRNEASVLNLDNPMYQPCPDEAAKADAALSAWARKCREDSMRYLVLLLLVAIYITLEFFLFQRTLAPNAIHLTFFAAGLILATAGSVLVIIFFFYEGQKRVLAQLEGRDPTRTEEVEQKHSVQGFFKSLFTQTPAGVILACPIGAFVLKFLGSLLMGHNQ